MNRRNKNPYVTECVRAALADKDLGWLPSKTLARLLHEREPRLFRTVEHAREIIRNHRGATRSITGGVKIKDPTFHRPHGNTSDGIIPLPTPLREPDTWQVIMLDPACALILSDAHIPFHDRATLELALRTGVDRKADTVILNGDWLDFYTCSWWERDPRLRHSLAEEIERGRASLEHVRARFPRARIIYKEGNHEERLWREAWRRCPEFFTLTDPDTGRPLLRLDSLLDFKEYGVELVANRQPIRLGEHLHVLHGHEWPQAFTNPVNPARGLFLRAGCNALCGHYHQSSNHTETGLVKPVGTFSSGCLCHLRPKYRPINKWNHGFAIVEIHGGMFSVDNKKIINGSVV